MMSKRRIGLLTVLSITVLFGMGAKKSDSEYKTDNPFFATESSSIYLDRSGKPAGLGDRKFSPSKAIRAGKGIHPKALKGKNIPKDKFGLVDWVQLTKLKIIDPQFSADPNAKESPILNLDVLIETRSDFVNDIMFPHDIHSWWLNCTSCHNKIFIPARGKNNMRMADMSKGKWCGECHNKVAFPLTDCKRCHTIPKKKVKAKK